MSTITTSTSATAWRPDPVAFKAAETMTDALIMRVSNVMGDVKGDEPALRVGYVDPPDATFTDEAATITENSPDLSECLVYTGKLANVAKISNEQRQTNDGGARTAEAMGHGLIKSADQAFLAQAAPTSPAVTPPAGLLNIDGIETGSAVTKSLDSVVDLLATLQGNYADPRFLIVDPAGWAELRKLKTATGSNLSILGAGTDDAELRLLGLDVIVSAAMSTKTGLIVDPSAVVSAVGDVEVAESRDYEFTNDVTVFRATWRIGWNLVHPDRVGTFTIGS